jgi:RsiW-degrading membrane proteinase PrsW (M82 family)
MIVLYFVHWLWNRLDISIDAIIKYFASGFFICTSMAILYEMLLSSLAYMALVVSAVFGSFLLVLTGSMTINMNDDDDGGLSQDGPKVNVPTPFVIALAIFGAFLNAFFVAGLVEEIAKYLCFWMVEHPDMVVADEADMASNESRYTLPSNQGETREPQYSKSLKETVLPPVSLTSRGAAITIAMVTTALGFACAENLLYVFVYTPPGIEAELSTLIVRCMFPVHPLAAALQSIGVCRRDLERDPSTHVGHIIFPAWLLHGTFDFVLMAFAVVTQVLEAKNEDDDAGEDSPAGEEEDGTEDEPVDPIEDLKSSAVLLSVVLLIPLLGLIYYFKEAWAQRKRLEELDSPLERTSGNEILESASETAERTLLLSRGV